MALRNEKQCFRKKSFPSQVEASRAADLRNVPLRVYRCPYCKWFHLTKAEPQKIPGKGSKVELVVQKLCRGYEATNNLPKGSAVALLHTDGNYHIFCPSRPDVKTWKKKVHGACLTNTKRSS